MKFVDDDDDDEQGYISESKVVLYEAWNSLLLRMPKPNLGFLQQFQSFRWSETFLNVNLFLQVLGLEISNFNPRPRLTQDQGQ